VASEIALVLRVERKNRMQIRTENWSIVSILLRVSGIKGDSSVLSYICGNLGMTRWAAKSRFGLCDLYISVSGPVKF